jgi:GDP-4-dehydro-6-deoxy-D-mannose reductase
MRVFVTGADGFVGRELLPRLIEAGHTPLALPLGLNICDETGLSQALVEARPDAVIHLAALSSVAQSHGDPSSVFRTNFLGSLFLLRACAAFAKDARVLLVGSGQQYGSASPDAAPFSESDPMRPGSPYAATKGAVDLLGAEYAVRGLDVLRLRPFNHTGPGQFPLMVAPNFAKQIAAIEAGRQEPLMSVGNLESRRDFLHVKDVVEAYLALLNPTVPAGAYNVCSGQGTSMKEILDTLFSLSSANPSIEVSERYFRPTDMAVGSYEKLHRACGWEPRIPLKKTLEEVLNYFRQHPDK